MQYALKCGKHAFNFKNIISCKNIIGSALNFNVVLHNIDPAISCGRDQVVYILPGSSLLL